MNTKPPASHLPDSGGMGTAHEHASASHEAIIACEIIIKWYKLNSRNLSGEEVLTCLKLQTLMRVLGNPDWNQVYHCWAVHSRQMHRLQPFVSHVFDKDRYVYFIEVYKSQPNT